MIWIVVIVIAGTIFLTGIIITLTSAFGGDRNKPYGNGKQGTKRRIAVDKGVDTKKLTYEQDKGAIFEAGQELYGTVYRGGGMHHMWKAEFDFLGTGRKETIAFREKMAIGRVPTSREGYPFLKIEDDKMISSAHCMLIGRQGVLVIRDLNSTNHTYLNEQRVNGMVQVPNGSVIRVGRTSMRVRYAYR